MSASHNGSSHFDPSDNGPGDLDEGHSIDEQGDLRKTFQLPDFVCLYLLGAANPDPPRLIGDADWGRTLGDQDIIERLMGPWQLEEGILAVIVEVKALQTRSTWSGITLQRAFAEAFKSATAQAERQASYHFKAPSTHTTDEVIGIACVVDWWTWTLFNEDNVVKLSDYVDGDFLPGHAESDTDEPDPDEPDPDEPDPDEPDPDTLPRTPKKGKGKKRAMPDSDEKIKLGHGDWRLYLQDVPHKRIKRAAAEKAQKILVESPLTPDNIWRERQTQAQTGLPLSPSAGRGNSSLRTPETVAFQAAAQVPSSAGTSGSLIGQTPNVIIREASEAEDGVVDPSSSDDGSVSRGNAGSRSSSEPSGADSLRNPMWSPYLSWLDPRSDEQRLKVRNILRERFPLAFANE